MVNEVSPREMFAYLREEGERRERDSKRDHSQMNQTHKEVMAMINISREELSALDSLIRSLTAGIKICRTVIAFDDRYRTTRPDHHFQGS